MLNKVPVKKLVEFRRYSERKRTNFADKLKIPKEPKLDDGGGGNYWIRSTSALCNAFKENDTTCIREKIDVLSPLYETSDNDRTRTMHKRNLEILHNYEDYDFSSLRPTGELKFLTKSKLPLTIKRMPIQVIPSHVFTYGSKDEPSIGAISFVIWLQKFNAGDLGIFSEALFRYLSEVYADQYKVDPNFCLTMDTLSMQTVSYNQLSAGEIPSLFDDTIELLRKYI